ncbi:hypothetical protein BVC80_59g7 [Macleaya cordata]|uniref:F-box associated domain n=1 Tax=Macleaya cordata TaxID=56857 RepID=A0A200QJD2_MACCD|nr:hypothetical protein BVC80_59g7 [Macleaya cordata]
MMFTLVVQIGSCHSELKLRSLVQWNIVERNLFLQDQMHLLEMEGQLYLCDPLSDTEIDLWVLNHTTKCWVKRHSLTLPRAFELSINRPNKFFLEVVHIKKGWLRRDLRMAISEQWFILIALSACILIQLYPYDGPLLLIILKFVTLSNGSGSGSGSGSVEAPN